MGGRSEQYVHDGAHLVPTCTGDFKRVLVDFLDRHSSAARSAVHAANSGSGLADGQAAVCSG